MADKILLCISVTQAVVAHMRGQATVHCEIFSSDEDGLEAFGMFLASLPRALVYIATDAVEEDYRFETLPHATGSDRADLLRRKLKQYYRNTPYLTAISRGRIGEKRRDDRYLFAALTNPALIDPWLAIIAKRDLPVAGIYMASMLTAALVRKVSNEFPRMLVVAPHGTGIRITFYKDGEFFISRLSRSGSGGNPEKVFATEISSTRGYLTSLHLDTLDEPLPVVFLDRNDSLSAVVEHVAAEVANLQCVRIDRSTLIRQLQIAPEHLSLALETAYLGLLAEKAPDANLAPTSVTTEYRQFQRRRSIYTASAALGLAGLLWSGYNLWDAYDLGEQATQTARLTTAAQTQYREITREFPATPTTSENLINAVEIYKKASKTIRSPQPFMQIVSRAIAPSAEVFLQEINWTYGTDEVNVDAGTRTSQPTDIAPTGALKQSGYITGEIRPFHGDYRAAIDTVNEVAKRLARDPTVAEVRVVKHPLNVNPRLALSGNTRDAAEQSGIADFKILITLKPDA
jgi:hypothetical protein